MDDFTKAVNTIRSEGIGVTVENLAYPIQVATIVSENMSGGFSRGIKSIIFDEEEISIIRELLSDVACGYNRKDYFHHCCDANEIISKIDETLEKD